MKTKLTMTVIVAGLALATQVPSAQADESASNSNAATAKQPATPANNATMLATPPLTPQQFVNDAMAGNLKEVYLSEMAMDRCTNAEVQHFAEHMLRDHRAANEKLVKIAREEGLTCLSSNLFRPDDPAWNNPALASEPAMKGEGGLLLISTNVPYYSDYRSVQMIKPLTGLPFRDAYITQMSDDHVMAINEYTMASQSLSDEKLKKYAEKNLPTLRKHLEMSQHLKSVEFESANTNVLSQSQPQPYTYPGMP